MLCRQYISVFVILCVLVASYGASSLQATPISSTNLILHLDANDASSFTFNGSDVAQWNDTSGNTNHASQGTPADQPLYVASGLNGLPVVRFDGASEYLELASTIDLTGGFEIFLVTTNVTAGDPLANGWQFSGPDRGFRINAAESGELRLAVHGTSVLSAAVSTPYEDIIGVTYSDASNDYVLRQTGTTTDSVTSSTEYSANSGWTSKVGASNNNSGGVIRFFDGDIAELVIYDTVLSDADRELVEGQLAWTWGLQSQLPVSHPYFNTSPFPVPEPSSILLLAGFLCASRLRRRRRGR